MAGTLTSIDIFPSAFSMLFLTIQAVVYAFRTHTSLVSTFSNGPVSCDRSILCSIRITSEFLKCRALLQFYTLMN